MLLFRAPIDFDGDALDVWERPMVFKSSNPKAVTEIVCSPADGTYYTDAELAQYPNLHILATASTGTNHIDLDACARRGIKVLSLLDDRDGLNTISASAEWTFKLILEGLRLKRPYHELQGRRVSLIGHGRIGKRVKEWCRTFGASVNYYDPPGGDNMLTLGSMFFGDVLVVCCSLTPETRGMIGYDLLERLPHDAVLVNTARGEIIDEDALARVMRERPDLRVCLDVVCGEVNGTAQPERLRQLGAYITPHIAGDTFESRTKAARIILGLLKKELATGNPSGAASPAAEESLAHVY